MERGPPTLTNVVQKAKGRIAAGREIRVDYDIGVVGWPFREQMIKRGVTESELDGSGYAEACWAYPGGGGASARASALDAAPYAGDGAAVQTPQRAAYA